MFTLKNAQMNNETKAYAIGMPVSARVDFIETENLYAPGTDFVHRSISISRRT